jgi:hypothetical protein
MRTLTGPDEPLKRVLPIMIQSKYVSVVNSVAVAYSGASAAMVHRSLLLWYPMPSVTQLPPLDKWQWAEPDVIDHQGRGGSGGGSGGGGAQGGGERRTPMRTDVVSMAIGPDVFCHAALSLTMLTRRAAKAAVST